MKIFLLALLVCFGIVAYYNKEELTTYAYGAYLKYWRLPYLKEDILECLKTGKPLSDYSKDTIKLAVKKSPEFFGLYLKGKLTPEQTIKVVTLLRDILDPEQAQEFCMQFIDTTVSSVKDCVEGVVHKAAKAIGSFIRK